MRTGINERKAYNIKRWVLGSDTSQLKTFQLNIEVDNRFSPVVNSLNSDPPLALARSTTARLAGIDKEDV